MSEECRRVVGGTLTDSSDCNGWTRSVNESVVRQQSGGRTGPAHILLGLSEGPAKPPVSNAACGVDPVYSAALSIQ